MGLAMSSHFKNPPPHRSKEYLDYIRSIPCCNCGNPASEAHHVNDVGSRGMGQKTDDYRCVPLCHTCHMQGHDGGWITWQEKNRVDLRKVQLLCMGGYIRMLENRLVY